MSPKNLKVYPLTSHTLQISWSPLESGGYNGHIKGYYLGFKMTDSNELLVFKTISADSQNCINQKVCEIKITDLKRATKYELVVQAFNSKGPGPLSLPVIGETLMNDPPPAPYLTIGNVTFTSIELNWNFNHTYHQSDLLISGYYIYYKSHSSEWEEKQISGHFSSFVIDNLDCGTSYQFYINAYNNIGKGDPSQVIAAKTKGSGKCLLFG
jgi:cell adhesion molecule, putative (fragment)